MSKAKKTTAAAPHPGLIVLAALVRHRLARRIALVLVVGAVGGGLLVAGWQKWGPAITAFPEFQLTAEKIEINAPPAWIHTNIKNDAIRAGGLADLSLLDPKLTEKVAHAFALQTWVAKVTRVSKHHPARVVVLLEYRKPVAMVFTEPKAFGPKDARLPVDASAVLLPPGDFSENQIDHYLRIDVGETQPQGPVGTPWGVPRVEAAARLAASLEDVWQKLGLYRIVLASALPGEVPTAPSFDILTRDGVRVVWGHAPGQEVSGEPGCSEKLAQLAEYAQKHGRLTNDGPQRQINLRNGRIGKTPAQAASAKADK